jgi:hypothetical protein
MSNHPTDMPTGGVINPDDVQCEAVPAHRTNPIVESMRQKLTSVVSDGECLADDYDAESYQAEKLRDVVRGVEYSLGHLNDVDEYID